MHGARGVILVNDTDHHASSQGETVDDLGKFSEANGPKDAGVLYIRMRYDVAEKWLKAEGRDLHAISKQIDQDGHPHSFALSNLSSICRSMFAPKPRPLTTSPLICPARLTNT